MLFNSYQFIFLFMPIVLAVCFLLARLGPRLGPGAAQLWLIGASLFFYTYWNPRYLPLLLLSIGFNYLVAVRMMRSDDARRRKWLLILAVAVNLGLLGYYKYTNFFVSSVTALTGWDYTMAAILLPLGISFYTFQQLTLLVDISAGATGAFRLRDFVLFVIFFPHLIAGPIVHHREMMPQFETATYRFNWTNMAVGLTLFAMGLFKKAVLADGIARSVSPLYAQALTGQPLGFLFGWAAAIGFILQVYFDFSGYSEMALGLGRMFGIKLPMNFNSPLKACSITEYWSRWHITLTRFLTAYLYTPITMDLTRKRMRSKKKVLAGSKTTLGAYANLVVVPTMITMFLSGLWHGAGYQFLVFGTLHGIYLTLNQGWRLLKLRFWTDTRSYERVMKPVGWVLTFGAVVLAIPFFHADTLPAAWNVVSGMLGLHGIALPQTIADRFAGPAATLAALGVGFVPASLGDFVTTWLWIAGLMAIVLLMPNVLEIMRDYEPAITMPGTSMSGRLTFLKRLEQRMVWTPSGGWAAATAVLAAGGILALNQVSEFLYWQF